MTDEIVTQGEKKPNNIFIGSKGLRAGWGILLFIVVFSVLAAVAVFTFKAMNMKPDAGGMTPFSVISGEGMISALLIVATLVTALIERRPLAQIGFGLDQRRAALPARRGARLHRHVGDDRRPLPVPRLRLRRHRPAWPGYLGLRRGMVPGLPAGRRRRRADVPHLPAADPGARHQLHHRRPDHGRALLLCPHAQSGRNPDRPRRSLRAGVLLSVSIWRTGTVWWAIGFHAAWDWAQSYVYGVADSGLVAKGALMTTHAMGPTWLSGGTTGPEGSIVSIAVTVVAAIVIWSWRPDRTSSSISRDGSRAGCVLMESKRILL
ncbi:MAG: CPBP family intramembrane glutamic endopeptidase [Asticcacaulis sp.]